MTGELSENTQAILLLTAPLMLGKRRVSADLLKPREYQQLARHLLNAGRQPADLLSPSGEEIINFCGDFLDKARLRELLGRGFLLSQAVDRWRSREIWVVSRADAAYPRRLKTKMKERAPAVLYGCGELGPLTTGGLAVVGSRRVNDALLAYSFEAGVLAAKAGDTVVSGGARGVDRAAMDGALSAGGRVVGVLAEELEREALDRKNRDAIRSRLLAFISEYDPCSRFLVGHAMQRNKLIYALADNALVVNSDLEKGGTWAGAVEQLAQLQFATVFVRSTGEPNRALLALIDKGAIPWPNPAGPGLLGASLRMAAASRCAHPMKEECSARETVVERRAPEQGALVQGSPADALFQKVQDVVLPMLAEPKDEEEVAALLEITREQARSWLRRLVEEGLLSRSEPPIRYHLRRSAS